jgi:hypothetical protein
MSDAVSSTLPPPPAPSITTQMDKINLSYTIQFFGFITLIVVGYIVLIILAVYARDFTLIQQHPFKFAFESILIGAGLALPFYYYGYLRNLPWRERHLIVFGLFVKFVSLHVLLQISGFYTGLHNDYNRPI